MSSKPPSTLFAKVWFRWKALKLPWRKRILIGLDLQGNTFWEFADALSADKHRMRRIVQYPPSTHYSEIKISPQWHQWLRHTRQEPPSLIEQSQDLVRQRNLKILAAQADARWAAKPSFLDKPERSQPLPAPQSQDPGGLQSNIEDSTSEQRNLGTEPRQAVAQSGKEQQSQAANATKDGLNERLEQEKRPEEEEKKKGDPWKNTRGGPSEEWQPQAWTGSVATRR